MPFDEIFSSNPDALPVLQPYPIFPLTAHHDTDLKLCREEEYEDSEDDLGSDEEGDEEEEEEEADGAEGEEEEAPGMPAPAHIRNKPRASPC